MAFQGVIVPVTTRRRLIWTQLQQSAAGWGGSVERGLVGPPLLQVNGLIARLVRWTVPRASGFVTFG